MQNLLFAEEIILLLLRDEDGRFNQIPTWSMDYAIAGAALMDLAMENRIDTDLENLILIDSSPVGDDILDPILAEVAAGGNNDTRYWVEQVSRKGAEIREQALDRLVERGILEREEDRFLWVFRSRRYPTLDGDAEREVKLRILNVLFSDEIPDPRDQMIICLADACGIFPRILSRQEHARAAERIAQVSRLDLIGQTMSQAIHDIQVSVAVSHQSHMI
ncbi:MAG: GPP34 family phosphoprotein [Chloroflexota bacterium]|nr:GPP34 family phosphoprotein [Chloroflexota bacterium]